MRPASWDASLIYDGEREERRVGRPASREEGEGARQFHRKENGRLPVRKKAEQRTTGETEREDSEGKSRGVPCIFEK